MYIIFIIFCLYYITNKDDEIVWTILKIMEIKDKKLLW